MPNADGTAWLVFNGEIYNYQELRAELAGYPFRTHSDTEVLLAAYERWGEACLDRFNGMFAFAIWDERTRTLFAARDRFGVKPLLLRHGAGRRARDRERDQGAARRRRAARAGRRGVGDLFRARHVRPRRDDVLERRSSCAARVGAAMERRARTRAVALVRRGGASARRRRGRARRERRSPTICSGSSRTPSSCASGPTCRSGVCLSGGLDSSLLLGLVARTHPDAGSVNAFTFYCDHPDYDERRWIEPLLARTPRPWHASLLRDDRCPGADDGGAAASGRAVGRLPDARDGDRARDGARPRRDRAARRQRPG